MQATLPTDKLLNKEYVNARIENNFDRVILAGKTYIKYTVYMQYITVRQIT